MTLQLLIGVAIGLPIGMLIVIYWRLGDILVELRRLVNK